MAYPATPKTWVAGDVLTAAQLNAELRNALLGAFPLGPPDVAWTSYTPTLTQSGAVTKTVTYARYTRVGRKITAEVKLDVTGAGTAANAVIVGLPVAAAAGVNVCLGSGVIYDASANLFYAGLARKETTDAVSLIPCSADSALQLGAAVFTAALASTDIVAFCVTYEAAT